MLMRPTTALHLAEYCSYMLWGTLNVRMISAGVYQQPETEHMLVLVGNAPLSDAAVTAARETGLLTEVLVETKPGCTPYFRGPDCVFEDADWETAVGDAALGIGASGAFLQVVEVWPISTDIDAASLFLSAGRVRVQLEADDYEFVPQEQMRKTLTDAQHPFLARYDHLIENAVSSFMKGLDS